MQVSKVFFTTVSWSNRWFDPFHCSNNLLDYYFSIIITGYLSRLGIQIIVKASTCCSVSFLNYGKVYVISLCKIYWKKLTWHFWSLNINFSFKRQIKMLENVKNWAQFHILCMNGVFQRWNWFFQKLSHFLRICKKSSFQLQKDASKWLKESQTCVTNKDRLIDKKII